MRDVRHPVVGLSAVRVHVCNWPPVLTSVLFSVLPVPCLCFVFLAWATDGPLSLTLLPAAAASSVVATDTMSGFNLLHLVTKSQPVKLKACGLPSGPLDAMCVCAVCVVCSASASSNTRFPLCAHAWLILQEVSSCCSHLQEKVLGASLVMRLL